MRGGKGCQKSRVEGEKGEAGQRKKTYALNGGKKTQPAAGVERLARGLTGKKREKGRRNKCVIGRDLKSRRRKRN